jgi:D-sedoheptulose 7-phosphate isomerase
MERNQFMNQKRLSELFLKDNSSTGYYGNYGKYLMQLMKSLNYDAVSNATECFLKARDRDATIFFIGNGGSAATASHFSQDLAEVGRKAHVRSFKTLSLTDNVSFITAAGNDYGFKKIFSLQMAELFKKGDILVAISASGNSPNVIEAVKYAKKKGGITIGIIGFDGGKLSGLCDYIIHICTNKGEYGPVEDIHIILNHMITSFLMFNLKNRKK